MSSSSEMKNTLEENFRIPLEEINSATNNFDKKYLIGEGRFGRVYKGQLSERWGNRAAAIRRPVPNRYQGDKYFELELQMLLTIHHQNIIPFIGYCVVGEEMIIVNEYAINGSLDDLLRDINRRSSLTWVQRLRICLGAAQALNHLHSTGLGVAHRILHCDVKSANILLDENMEAKICDFGLSKYVPRYLLFSQADTMVAGTQAYVDPLYMESGILTIESDVYSLGVVLFEMLSGMLAYARDDKQRTLINLVRGSKDGGLDKIIDPLISDQINSQSLKTFQRVAYRCINFEKSERPTMDEIIREIEKALHIQLLEFVIPLEEINKATNNFDEKNVIGEGGFGVVYKGKLSHFWDNLTVAVKCLQPKSLQVKDEFKKEHQMVSKFHHPNIIPFIGYCDEGDKKIIVYEYAINGSLDDHLEDRGKRCSLTWVKRLKICLGVARGLGYLHSGFGDHKRVIHRDVKSGNILLDDNLEAKICDFGLTRSVPRNKTITQLHTGVGGTPFYLDPLYQESSILTKQSDVYSFGVVLFEVLTGRLAYPQWSIGYDEAQTLIPLVRENWYGGLREIIDPLISEQINTPSLNTFKRIAYKCISLVLDERPTMDTIIKKIEKSLALQENRYHEDLKIQLEEPKNFLTLADMIFKVLSKKFPLEKIKLATNNFSKEYLIDGDAHGNVYKGQLYKPVTIAAIKRLPPELRKTKDELLKEISVHFTLCHQNIISIIGYCDEGNEMITIYEYAMNGSIDDHLKDPNRRRSLMWAQRLKICIGVAGGLKYLHSGLKDDCTVIHGNVKSSNIFLDENFEAKISDFGLSKSLHRNQPDTQVQTMVGGTRFYLDPIYNESGILTKESDVYSLGVVLFEMLSGMLAYQKRRIGNNDPLHLINLVRENWDGGLDGIIDGDISDQINSRSLETFKRVAYTCISLDLKERPTMDSIMEELQKALHFQENNDISQQYDTDKDTNP